MATGAPDKVNDYSLLWVWMLTTNQVVGSSNLSGRAIYNKGSTQKRRQIQKSGYIIALGKALAVTLPVCVVDLVLSQAT